MPVGDIAAMNAARTADRLEPRSHVIGNVVPSAIVERRRRRDERSDYKSERRRRSRYDHGVISASEHGLEWGQPSGGMRSSTLDSRKVSPSNASILVSVPSSPRRCPDIKLVRGSTASEELSVARLAIDLARFRKYGPPRFGA
jgi:hypothetical protein